MFCFFRCFRFTLCFIFYLRFWYFQCVLFLILQVCLGYIVWNNSYLEHLLWLTLCEFTRRKPGWRFTAGSKSCNCKLHFYRPCDVCSGVKSCRHFRHTNVAACFRARCISFSNVVIKWGHVKGTHVRSFAVTQRISVNGSDGSSVGADIFWQNCW